MRVFTAAATASAFAPGASAPRNRPPAARSTSGRSRARNRPGSTRATSLSRTAAPSALVRSRMFSNSCGVEKRPSADTVAVNICVSGEGSPPTCRRRTARSARAPRPAPARRTGRRRAACPGSARCSSRIRRRTAGCCRRRARARSGPARAMRADRTVRPLPMAGLDDFSATTSRKPELAFATVTPCCTTSVGRRGVACDTLFCTCICAMSGSVPGLKVMLIELPPFDPTRN